MKEKLKKVYYCEHCKKKSLRKDIILKHENYCTNNPNRQCRMCENKDLENAKSFIKDIQSDTKLYAYFESKEGLEELKQKVVCPSCLLYIFRQTKVHNWNFDYKKECKSWWVEVNY